jgi:hypothetical protein
LIAFADVNLHPKTKTAQLKVHAGPRTLGDVGAFAVLDSKWQFLITCRLVSSFAPEGAAVAHMVRAMP